MKTKTILLLALVLSITTFTAAQDKMSTSKPNSDEQALMAMEKAAWQNLVNKKYDEFDKMIADDYQGVYSDGITTKAGETGAVRKMTFKSADVSDVKVTMLDKNVALITAVVKANMVEEDGKEMNNISRTSSVAVKRNGKWMIVYHSDVSMKP
jgi:hypothetical protein